MNVFNLVRDQFGSVAKDHLGSLLGRQPATLSSGVNDSIGAVLDGFSSIAGDAGGREVLYEAVRYCDDDVVENPAKLFENRDSREVFVEGHNRLAGLVGVAQKDNMIERLKVSAKLSHGDAEDLLGYVTPGVLGVLKRQIEQGVFLDNPDGIGQMFLGEGDPKTAPPKQHGGGEYASNGGQAVAMSEESDTSWLFRYVLPFALLGGLVLAGMKNCGNIAGKKIVAQQESIMQLELDGVRAEADAAKGQVLSLQGAFDASEVESAELLVKTDDLSGDLELAKANTVALEGDLETARAEYESAQAEAAELAAKTEALNGELEVAKENIVTLEGVVETTKADLDVVRAQSADLDGQVQRVTAELLAVKDVPTETSALQGLLSSVTSERDSSNSAFAQLQSDFDGAVVDRQVALDEAARLQDEVNAVTAEMKANEEALANLAATQAELEEVTAARDEAIALNAEYEASTIDLQGQLDVATPKIDELQRQLGSAANLRTELQGKITSTEQALEEEKSNREADVSKLSLTSTDLQGQLGAMLGLRDEAVGTLALRDGEVSSLGDRVVTLEGELVALQGANAKAKEEAAQLEEKIAALNGELDTATVSVDEARVELASTEDTLASVVSDLETARGDVATVSAERDDLLNKRDALASRVEELMVEKDSAIGETVQLNEQIVGLTTDLDAANASDAASVGKLGLLTESFSGLQVDLGQVTSARDEMAAQVSELRTETSELRQEVVKLDEELITAQAAHDEAMAAMQVERDSVQGELDGTITTLKSEIGSLESQRDAALAKTEEADAQLVLLNDEKDQAQAAVDDLSVQSESLQAALQKEQGSVAELQTTMAGLESTKMLLTEERDGAASQVTKLSEEIAALQQSLQSEQATVSDLTATVATLEASEAALTADRAEAADVIELLDNKVMENGKEIDTLVDSNSALQKQIDQAAARVQADKDATLGVRSSVEDSLVAAGLAEATVASIEDDSAVAIVLGSGDLYGVGSAELSPQGRDILAIVGSVVTEYPDWSVDVEGHTDSQGIGAVLRQKYPTNWELSSARASATVRFLSSRAGIDADKLSAHGFGETRPLDSNETSQGREKNRRVEVILRR